MVDVDEEVNKIARRTKIINCTPLVLAIEKDAQGKIKNQLVEMWTLTGKLGGTIQNSKNILQKNIEDVTKRIREDENGLRNTAGWLSDKNLFHLLTSAITDFIKEKREDFSFLNTDPFSGSQRHLRYWVNLLSNLLVPVDKDPLGLKIFWIRHTKELNDLLGITKGIPHLRGVFKKILKTIQPWRKSI